MLAAAAATMLFAGAAQGADPSKPRDLPGFREMDKNDDGALTRAEAAGNPQLLERFKEVDEDGDGNLSRYEYFKSLAKEEFTSLRERVADWIEPGGAGASSAGR
jgi:hypothetical protein